MQLCLPARLLPRAGLFVRLSGREWRSEARGEDLYRMGGNETFVNRYISSRINLIGHEGFHSSKPGLIFFAVCGRRRILHPTMAKLVDYWRGR